MTNETPATIRPWQDEKFPDAVRAAITAADTAAHDRLAQITVADLLAAAH